jgi:hypothetical protein
VRERKEVLVTAHPNCPAVGVGLGRAVGVGLVGLVTAYPRNPAVGVGLGRAGMGCGIYPIGSQYF